MSDRNLVSVTLGGITMSLERGAVRMFELPELQHGRTRWTIVMDVDTRQHVYGDELADAAVECFVELVKAASRGPQ